MTKKTTSQTPVYRCYRRCSTDMQVESGLGLDAQKTQCREYVKRTGGRIVKWYTDEGISGAKGIENRPALDQLLKDVQPGEIVLVAKQDRLARSLNVSASITECLKRLNVTVEYADGMGNGHTAMDEFLSNLNLINAVYERSRISERVKSAMKELNRKVGRLPYGYKWDKNGRQIKDPKTFPNLERLLELRAEGLGVRKIARMMDAEGRKPQRSENWNPSSITRLFTRLDGNRPCAWDEKTKVA